MFLPFFPEHRTKPKKENMTEKEILEAKIEVVSAAWSRLNRNADAYMCLAVRHAARKLDLQQVEYEVINEIRRYRPKCCTDLGSAFWNVPITRDWRADDKKLDLYRRVRMRCLEHLEETYRKELATLT